MAGVQGVGLGAGPALPGPMGPVGPMGSPGASTAASDQRYRSFVERYVIARACFFRVGHEKEDAWAATEDATTIYKKIGRNSRRYVDDAETETP